MIQRNVMKRINIFLLLFLLLQVSALYADIPVSDFEIIDVTKHANFKLGDRLSKVKNTYGVVTPVVQKYSNRTLKTFQYEGISFSISSLADPANDNIILQLETNSKFFETKRHIRVGSSKQEIIKEYGLPEYDEAEFLYYSNSETDHMALVFFLTDKGYVSRIQLSVGT